MSRDGAARPVSTKLKWRAEISASPARSSWLRWRRCRHSRRWSPTWTGWVRSARAAEVCAFMAKTYHANFVRSITSEVIELGRALDHLWIIGDDHADAFPCSQPRRPDPVDAQSGNPGVGPLSQPA